jgi:hypothetical protein
VASISFMIPSVKISSTVYFCLSWLKGCNKNQTVNHATDVANTNLHRALAAIAVAC